MPAAPPSCARAESEADAGPGPSTTSAPRALGPDRQSGGAEGGSGRRTRGTGAPTRGLRPGRRGQPPAPRGLSRGRAPAALVASAGRRPQPRCAGRHRSRDQADLGSPGTTTWSSCHPRAAGHGHGPPCALHPASDAATGTPQVGRSPPSRESWAPGGGRLPTEGPSRRRLHTRPRPQPPRSESRARSRRRPNPSEGQGCSGGRDARGRPLKECLRTAERP